MSYRRPIHAAVAILLLLAAAGALCAGLCQWPGRPDPSPGPAADQARPSVCVPPGPPPWTKVWEPPAAEPGFPAVEPRPQPPPGAPPADVPARRDGIWKLVFEDEFERKELGENWKAVTGVWSIKDGHLFGRHTDGEQGERIICLAARAPDNVRVEYSGHLETPPDWEDVKPPICWDLSAMIGVEPQAGKFAYFFSYSGCSNYGQHIDSASKALASNGDETVKPRPGEKHHVICQRLGDKLELIVDGKTLVSTTGLLGPMVPGDRVELYGFVSHTYYDWVRVWTAETAETAEQGPGQDTPPLEAPEVF